MCWNGRPLSRLIHAGPVIAHVVFGVSEDRASAMLRGRGRSDDQMAVSHPPKQLIPGFLGRVRALLYRHEARRAVLYAVAAILGLAVVLPLLGYLLGDSREI